MHFIYDGTYPGFLTAVYEIYHFGTGKLEDIRRDEGESSLFGMTYLVDTRLLKAEKVASAFEKKCGKRAMGWMYRAFLSNFEGREMKIFFFMKEGFKLGKKIYTRQKEPWVQDILSMCRAVGNETEKFRGILRFSELEDGTLYAVIRPDHFILPLLAVHFKDRLPGKRWAIYDSRRREAAVYENGRVSIVQMEQVPEHMRYSSAEEDFRQLWRNYYRHMGIEDRRNPAERMNFLPKKYWPCLTEMEDSYNRGDLPLKGLDEKKRPGAGKTISQDALEDVLHAVELRLQEGDCGHGKKQ
ncbi:TIGR03915 family putative DNA repair protein [uncultured Dialister sp.]|uniref:TIGR03915 family putative DNA repair protein n=1 Tax=uncultured Dialister sp. TaxID=278064 RepID=UPI002608C69A|nr:TIGR03915 family putative DNA repair protein [uncultured Dialister sp.]